MHHRPLALIAALALTGGLSACGGGDVTGDVVPREAPELVAPGEGTSTLPPAATASDPATTTTGTGTETTSTDAAPTTSGGTVAPSATPPAATTPSQNSGGAAAPSAGGTTGGTADPGGFSDFCTQNPGACEN